MSSIDIAQRRDGEAIEQFLAFRGLINAPRTALRAAGADDAEAEFFFTAGLGLIGQKLIGVPHRNSRGAHRRQAALQESATRKIAFVEHGRASRSGFAEVCGGILSDAAIRGYSKRPSNIDRTGPALPVM